MVDVDDRWKVAVGVGDLRKSSLGRGGRVFKEEGQCGK